ncbi:MAG: HpcH/HpaI aldolase family protein [Prosthecobacter sp.]
MKTLTLLATLAMHTAATAQEPRRLSHLVDTLASDRAAVGIFSSVREFTMARVVGAGSLDYQIIDMEHGPFDTETLRQQLVNLRRPDGSFSVTPIVRIPANGSEVHANRWMFKQVLDAGAFGVMVPMVNNAEEARQAAIAMRYPPAKDNPAQQPRGVRGWSSTIAAIGTWNVPAAEYTRKADLWPLNPEGELILAVQIESVEAINNLREILAVPGVGAAFIGPADLHADMGHLGRTGVPEVEKEIQRALAIGRELRVPMGITTRAEDARVRLEQGFRFFTVPSEAGPSADMTDALKAIER